jgi:hypothetical protein
MMRRIAARREAQRGEQMTTLSKRGAPQLLKRRALSKLLLSLCALLGVVGLTSLEGVSARSALAAPLKVSVDVISAHSSHTSKTKRVDPQLSSVRATLLKSFPQLDDFKLLSRERLSLLEEHTNARVKIGRALTAQLALVKREGSHVTMKVRVPQKSADFTVKVRQGELFFQAMRWRGVVYLLAIKAY